MVCNWWGASGGANTSGAQTTLGTVTTSLHLSSAPSSCTINPNPTPTPTLTLTPTVPICEGFSLLEEEGCPPTPEDFGVVVSEDCDLTERNAILAGTIDTAEALKLQFGGDPASDTFQRVMLNAAQSRTQIEFICSDVSETYCETNNDVAPPLQAQITCYDDVDLTKYTVVHEYGHVFTGRMGGHTPGVVNYYNLIFQPASLTTETPEGVIFDSVGQVVMGNRNDPLNGTPNWVRGVRGWGSAASTPSCNFQQNAYSVSDWLVTATPDQPAQTQERDEAAADMFLNWVYTEISQGGFQNADYNNITDCTTTPTPDLTRRPGDARENYMETIAMPTLATFVPTSTP